MRASIRWALRSTRAPRSLCTWSALLPTRRPRRGARKHRLLQLRHHELVRHGSRSLEGEPSEQRIPGAARSGGIDSLMFNFGATALIGSPSTIREQLKAFEDTNVDAVIFTTGAASHKYLVESMELVAEEVLPEFREKAGATRRVAGRAAAGLPPPRQRHGLSSASRGSSAEPRMFSCSSPMNAEASRSCSGPVVPQ